MQNMICTGCGTVGEGKTATPGSLGIELVLWFAFCIPGLLYSLWRLTNRQHNTCPACGGRMIPTSTPLGREMKERVERSASARRNFAEDESNGPPGRW